MSAPDDTTPRREPPTRAEVLATLDTRGSALGLASTWAMHFRSGKIEEASIGVENDALWVYCHGPLSSLAGTLIRWQCLDTDGAPMPWSKLADLVVEAQRGGQEVAPC